MLTRHNTMKNNVGLFKTLISQPHTTEGLIIEDVDATASVDEHLSELIHPNLRSHHQGQVTRIINPGRMIFPTPHNRLLRPSQILWNRRLNSIHIPLMKLLVSLAQTSSKHMILSTIELLWIGLVSPLLLLMMTLAGLLIKTPLTILRIGI